MRRYKLLSTANDDIRSRYIGGRVGGRAEDKPRYTVAGIDARRTRKMRRLQIDRTGTLLALIEEVDRKGTNEDDC